MEPPSSAYALDLRPLRNCGGRAAQLAIWRSGLSAAIKGPGRAFLARGGRAVMAQGVPALAAADTTCGRGSLRFRDDVSCTGQAAGLSALPVGRCAVRRVGACASRLLAGRRGGDGGITGRDPLCGYAVAHQVGRRVVVRVGFAQPAPQDETGSRLCEVFVQGGPGSVPCRVGGRMRAWMSVSRRSFLLGGVLGAAAAGRPDSQARAQLQHGPLLALPAVWLTIM